jgi:hypothetical protein
MYGSTIICLQTSDTKRSFLSPLEAAQLAVKLFTSGPARLVTSGLAGYLSAIFSTSIICTDSILVHKIMSYMLQSVCWISEFLHQLESFEPFDLHIAIARPLVKIWTSFCFLKLFGTVIYHWLELQNFRWTTKRAARGARAYKPRSMGMYPIASV